MLDLVPDTRLYDLRFVLDGLSDLRLLQCDG